MFLNDFMEFSTPVCPHSYIKENMFHLNLCNPESLCYSRLAFTLVNVLGMTHEKTEAEKSVGPCSRSQHISYTSSVFKKENL